MGCLGLGSPLRPSEGQDNSGAIPGLESSVMAT